MFVPSVGFSHRFRICCSGWRGYYISAQHARAKKILEDCIRIRLRNCSWNDDSAENLALALVVRRLAFHFQSDKQRFREQLALLDIGLEDRMNHPVGLLSGGQRQALTLFDGNYESTEAASSG